jgi:hypothetical protein
MARDASQPRAGNGGRYWTRRAPEPALKERGPVLLRGDLMHFRENYDTNGVPSFNTDRAQTIASLDRFKKIAEALKAMVIIQHDMRDIGKLPALPSPRSDRYSRSARLIRARPTHP